MIHPAKQESTAIFATAYLPLREYLLHLSSFDNVVLDENENWTKQSLRNRTFILSANGIQPLIVPVQHNGGLPTAVKEIKISYNDPWLRLHKGALEAAYNTSPFFEFIKDDLWDIYNKKHTFLFDLNSEILQWLIRKFKLPTKLISQTESIENEHKKMQFLSNKNAPNPDIEMVNQMPSYSQVFSYKFDFQQNLSSLDVLANSGHIHL